MFVSIECCKIDSMQEMKRMLEDMKREMAQGFRKTEDMVKMVNSVVDRIQDMEVAWGTMEDRVRWLEEKVDYLENQSRRNNIVLYGVGEEEDESWDMTSEIVRHVIRQTGVAMNERDIERAHRVGHGRYPRPIVCKLAHYKVKEEIIRSARFLRGTGVAISEDHSRRVREERAFLKRHLIDARKQGARAFIRFDKLVINGRVRSRRELEEMRRQHQEQTASPAPEVPTSTPDTAQERRTGNAGAVIQEAGGNSSKKTADNGKRQVSPGRELRSRMSDRLANTMRRGRQPQGQVPQ